MAVGVVEVGDLFAIVEAIVGRKVGVHEVLVSVCDVVSEVNAEGIELGGICILGKSDSIAATAPEY